MKIIHLHNKHKMMFHHQHQHMILYKIWMKLLINHQLIQIFKYQQLNNQIIINQILEPHQSKVNLLLKELQILFIVNIVHHIQLNMLFHLNFNLNINMNNIKIFLTFLIKEYIKQMKILFIYLQDVALKLSLSYSF